MLTDYIEAALKRAMFERLSDDGSYYGEIPEFQGVWANAGTLYECFEELRRVLEEWIVLRLTAHKPLPTVGNLSLTAAQPA